MANRPLPKPDFFILGAGKSGTTSLYYYLSQHPEIFMSADKEPSFFCDVFQVVRNPIDYFALFAKATQKRIGEASHVYLSYPKTAPVLRTLFPDARFLLILRNPVDRAYSLYYHMARHGYEWLSSFEKALDREEERFSDPWFEKHNPQYFYNYLYFRSGLYGEQISRYLEWFERERFLFLTLDELLADPLSVVRRIWTFLDVDPTVVPSLEVQNAGGGVRSAPWQFFLKHQLEPLLNRFKVPGGEKLVSRLMRRNTSGVRIPPMRPATRARLEARYAADLALTQQLTGLDLSSWTPKNADRSPVTVAFPASDSRAAA